MKYLIIAVVLIFNIYAEESLLERSQTPKISLLELFSEELDESVLNSEAIFNDNLTFSSGWSGAGGDEHRHISDNIWYLGDKAVHYCIKSASNYPLSKNELSNLVKQSFEDWRTFFLKYRIGAAPKVLLKENPSLSFQDNIVRNMTMSFEEKECDDLKSKIGEELIFLFGVENKITKKFRNLNYENALGMALRYGYNHKVYRNRGFVSISNFDNDTQKIHHLLLHEIGHVFGMKHDSVFVMDADVAKQLAEGRIPETFLGKIESPWWVYKLDESSNLNITYKRSEVKAHSFKGRCNDYNYRSNRSIPDKVRTRLGFNKRGCHRVDLKVEKILGPKKYRVSVTIKQRNGKEFLLNGVLASSRAKPLESNSPGVYSLFQTNRRNSIKTQYVRLPYDSIFQFPAFGSLLGKRNKFGIRLDMNKGVDLELFFPSVNVWWILK